MMPAKWAPAVLLLLLCGWLRGEGPISTAPAAARIVPALFDSREAADRYARELFAGGCVDTLKVGKEEVLVVYVHGSGVPDIAIAAYRFADGRWILALEWRPPTIEFHKAIASGSEIVIVGRESGKKWVLLKVE